MKKYIAILTAHPQLYIQFIALQMNDVEPKENTPFLILNTNEDWQSIDKLRGKELFGFSVDETGPNGKHFQHVLNLTKSRVR